MTLAGVVLAPAVLFGPTGQAAADAAGAGAVTASTADGREDGAEVVLRWQDPRIIESSGLVSVGRWLVTTNDSGDVGRVFTVAARGADAGETVGVTTWSQDAVDVEALAPGGPGHVWVGDIGDNEAQRDSIAVTRVPVGVGDRTVDSTVYTLVYPDGAHDAETLLRDPTTGRLYVVTKELLGGTVYAAPRTLDPDGTNRLRRVGPVLPIATDGTFALDGSAIVVRGYFGATLYEWPSLRELRDVALPVQDQGEGLAITRGGGLLESTEGRGTAVLRVPTSAALRARLRGDEPADATPSASASSGAAGDSAGDSAGGGVGDVTGDVTASVPGWVLAGIAGLAGVLVLGVLVALAVAAARGLRRR
ncbi:hypothetical protein [Nocardioides sp. GY 10127]|uniref:hypothetical protein n=1 Tax=Nocardioides sp. GY 10127 TaxID=2569762 RepID=UPI0010A80B17|nr:hypothetical protein [Nocardioides sp. GY 10127]TIC79928.1 hypothetical protein E8D37_14880 [Nocardioides sp. GY 10127]